MMRFDLSGSKLNHNIDFPKSFNFDKQYLNDELARHETNGWIENSFQRSNSLLSLINPFDKKALE